MNNGKLRFKIDILDVLFSIVFVLTSVNINTFHIKEIMQGLLGLYLFIDSKHNGKVNIDVLYRIGFTLWCSVSVFWAIYSSISIIRALSTVQTLLLFYSGFCYICEKKDIRRITGLLVITAIIYVLGILASYPIAHILRGRVSMDERIRFLGMNPNAIGILLVYGAMSLLQYIESYKRKSIAIMGASVFIIFAFLTGSKKAFFTCIIGIFMILLMKSKNMSAWIRNVIIGISIVGIIIYLCFTIESFYSLIGVRLETFVNYLLGNSSFADDKSTWGRGYLIEWAKATFYQHPILGIGIGNFQYTNSLQKYAHNNYWEILVNLGLVGFALYYIPFIKETMEALKIRFRMKDTSINFPLILLITILLNDYANITYTNELFTLLIGCIFATIQVNKRGHRIREIKGES